MGLFDRIKRAFTGEDVVQTPVTEENKIVIRGHRREANELFKELKTGKEISEDEMHKAQSEVQKITDDFIKKVDEITAEKEKEIIEF